MFQYSKSESRNWFSPVKTLRSFALQLAAFFYFYIKVISKSHFLWIIKIKSADQQDKFYLGVYGSGQIAALY